MNNLNKLLTIYTLSFAGCSPVYANTGHASTVHEDVAYLCNTYSVFVGSTVDYLDTRTPKEILSSLSNPSMKGAVLEAFSLFVKHDSKSKAQQEMFKNCLRYQHGEVTFLDYLNLKHKVDK